MDVMGIVIFYLNHVLLIAVKDVNCGTGTKMCDVHHQIAMCAVLARPDMNEKHDIDERLGRIAVRLVLLHLC